MSDSMSIGQFQRQYVDALAGRYGEDAEISFGEITRTNVGGVEQTTMSVTITVNGETKTVPVEIPDLDAPSGAGADYLLRSENAEQLAQKLDDLVQQMRGEDPGGKALSSAHLQNAMLATYDMMALFLEIGIMLRMVDRETRNSELVEQMSLAEHSAEAIREGAREAKTIAMVSAIVGGAMLGASMVAQGVSMKKALSGAEKVDLPAKTDDLRAANLEQSPSSAQVKSDELLNKLSHEGQDMVTGAFEESKAQVDSIQEVDQAKADLKIAQDQLGVAQQKLDGLKVDDTGDGAARIRTTGDEIAVLKETKAEAKAQLKVDTKALIKQQFQLKKEETVQSQDTAKLEGLRADLEDLQNAENPDQAKIGNLTNEIRTLEDGIRARQTRIDDVKAEIGRLENSIPGRQTAIEDADKSIAQKQAFLDGAKIAQKGGGENLTKAKEAAQQKVDELTDKVNNLQATVGDEQITDVQRENVRSQVKSEFDRLETQVNEKVARGEISSAEGDKILKAARYYRSAQLAKVSTKEQVQADLGGARIEFKAAGEAYDKNMNVQKWGSRAQMMATLAQAVPLLSGFLQSLGQQKMQQAEAEVKELEALSKQQEIQMNDSSQLFENAERLFQDAKETVREIIRSMVEVEKNISHGFA